VRRIGSLSLQIMDPPRFPFSFHKTFVSMMWRAILARPYDDKGGGGGGRGEAAEAHLAATLVDVQVYCARAVNGGRAAESEPHAALLWGLT